MNTKPEPSWYRYCISRRSTFAVSTLVSELNVLSTTLPDSTCFSLVRTTVLPLPGLWCWNHTTDHSWPSRSSTMPFFRSFVDATTHPPACAPSRQRPSLEDPSAELDRPDLDAERLRRPRETTVERDQRNPVAKGQGDI